MWKKIIAMALALALPGSASAGPIAEAMEREARKLASAQQADSGGRGSGRVWTGIALIGAGAVLAVLGAMELGGGEDEGPNDPAEPSDAGETGGKAMLAGGIGAGALGAVLLLTGRRSSPSAVQIRPAGVGVGVRHTIRF